jgi:uncharacterized membrane protein HdeD (DUF308 family)
MVNNWSLLMLGAIAMGWFVAGLQFLRFWRDGRDRFFLLFALSFFVEGCGRLLVAVSERPNEGSPYLYLLRLLAYGLIIWAIVEKNRRLSTKAVESITGSDRIEH